MRKIVNQPEKPDQKSTVYKPKQYQCKIVGQK
jgi:hypothetical protein